MQQAVILAGGESSRFWPLNKKNKCLFRLMGRPLIFYTIESLEMIGIKDIIIVQGKEKDIENELKDYSFKADLNFVVQDDHKGMGDALLKTKEFIKGSFLALSPYQFRVHDLIDVNKLNDGRITLFGRETSMPWNYGVLKIENGKAIEISEKPEKGEEPSNVKAVALYVLPLQIFDYLSSAKEDHYSFENAINLCLKETGPADLITVNFEIPSIKFPWDLLLVARVLLNGHLKKGTDSSVWIGKNAVIEKNVYIGKNTKVFENAVIKGPCYIGDNCVIGNNVLVRESILEDNVVVGANSEVARTILQEHCHVHSGYFGDSILGEYCKVGAGTVTANVRIDRGEIKATVKDSSIETGLKSLGVIVGEHTSIGINSSLMPGVLIGSNSVIGPTTTVMDNVADAQKIFSESQITRRG